MGKRRNDLDLSIKIGGINFKNPVMVASGTFGFAEEYEEYVDINQLGAVITKGITLKPREGNPPPRIYETRGGILNSIGLQNPGIKAFLTDKLPYLRKLRTNVIVNIAGTTIGEFEELARMLDIEGIAGVEVNVSCPNVEDGGISFGVKPHMINKITNAVRGSTSKLVIVKLTPEAGNIIDECAKAAEEGGADAVSLINTVVGMAIDIKKRRPFFKRVFAGLSGPAIKPIAVAMVHRVSNAVNIPIVASGGILSGTDALEFLIAGATAIAVGTGNLADPECSIRVLNQMKELLKEMGGINSEQRRNFEHAFEG